MIDRHGLFPPRGWQRFVQRKNAANFGTGKNRYVSFGVVLISTALIVVDFGLFPTLTLGAVLELARLFAVT